MSLVRGHRGSGALRDREPMEIISGDPSHDVLIVSDGLTRPGKPILSLGAKEDSGPSVAPMRELCR
jgi:hypothetical protein